MQNTNSKSLSLSVITLNVNGSNFPVKIHRLAEWIQTYDPITCCQQETHFRSKDINRLKVKGWKKIYMQIPKRAEVTTNSIHKIDFNQNRLQDTNRDIMY